MNKNCLINKQKKRKHVVSVHFTGIKNANTCIYHYIRNKKDVLHIYHE